MLAVTKLLGSCSGFVAAPVRGLSTKASTYRQSYTTTTATANWRPEPYNTCDDCAMQGLQAETLNGSFKDSLHDHQHFEDEGRAKAKCRGWPAKAAAWVPLT